MSTGSKAIPLLKSAPEPDQLADRLNGGDWKGIEIALMPQHLADDGALARAVESTRDVVAGMVVTAEAPVAWPSGAFVRVDRLDDEARAGIERSAEFAAAVGSPVLTIHLFIPLSPDEFRARGDIDAAAVEEFLGFFAQACTSRGVQPLIENVPPVRRLGDHVGFIVAEINEPDPKRSGDMKRAYHAIESALGLPEPKPFSAPRRLPADDFDWQAVIQRHDPVPALLELQERFGGRRI